MNKGGLITQVAAKTNMTKKAASDAVEAVLDSISEALIAGERITLVGFGTFEVRDRAARKGVNPSTGQALDIPASRVPAFKAGRSLRDSVAG